jgi:hypothetical protein
MADETMDEAHRADMRAERVLREAGRALDAVLELDRRLPPKARDRLEATRTYLREQADHIVAVWD